ncbi:MAG: nucleotidyltransferase domain-containing protein [Planctomycetales bacterium]|nr:nucleotidyltransferase domain-containing protein [Planctomycetales bacterium]
MVSVIEDKMKELAGLCRRYHVSRLEVFGSAATEDMHAASDLDFLVEFDQTVRETRFDNFFAFQEALASLFNRPVDLVEPGGLRNPYFIRSINETRKAVYAAS